LLPIKSLVRADNNAAIEVQEQLLYAA